MTRKRVWFFTGASFATVVVLTSAASWYASRGTLPNGEIDALCAKLIDPDTAVREEAANKLGTVTGAASIRRMAMHLGIGDPNIASRLTFILGGMGARAVAPLADVSRTACKGLAPARFPWTNGRLRRWRAAWLGLPKNVDVGDWAVGAQSFLPQALGNIGRPARPTLLKMMGDSDSTVRHLAMEALVQMGDPQDFEMFMSMLSGSDADEAEAGAMGLCHLELTRRRGVRNPNASDDAAWQAYTARRGEAVKALIASVENRNALGRQGAARALGEYDDSAAAMDAVFKIMRDTSEGRYIRTAAGASAADSTDPRARQALISMLGDADPEVRNEAARFLPEDAATVAAVALALDSPDALVRQGAMSYFIQTSRHENLHYITDSYEGFTDAGRQAAVETLRKISAGVFAGRSRHPDVVKKRSELQQAAREALAKIALESTPAGDEGGPDDVHKR